MTMIYRNRDTQILLPIYQLFARLVALPSHREALARWIPPSASSSGPSTILSLRTETPLRPFILTHLLTTISAANGAPADRKLHGKLLEAALDLLAAVVKGQPAFAQIVRKWNSEGEELEDDMEGSGSVSWLMDLLLVGPIPVRIAAANWCVGLWVLSLSPPLTE
jgi:hypothetical protein